METSHDDDDDVEFAPRKAIKLEDAANSAGNLCWLHFVLCFFCYRPTPGTPRQLLLLHYTRLTASFLGQPG